MTDRETIERVARLAGIEARYTDGLGRTREVSDATLLALIEAFGLPSDPIRAMHTLAENEQRAPLGLSPAYLVAAKERNHRVNLRLPTGCREVFWSCRLENGEHRSGRVSEIEGGRYAMPLPDGLPLGYHRLDLEAGGVPAGSCLIVAPDRC